MIGGRLAFNDNRIGIRIQNLEKKRETFTLRWAKNVFAILGQLFIDYISDLIISQARSYKV